ncbi:MAG: tyrosine--tRNA ligase [Mycoplasmataceae bacterium]|nr:tyrosine--tRNA ligase [Mycoplasmataceae bacterium]
MGKILELINDLKKREIINNITNEEKLTKIYDGDGIYIGFDPTAKSLHLGNYIPITILKRFQKIGLESFAILGGATGMIGDPSFKDSERVLLDNDTIQINKKNISKQLESFDLKVIDNYEFYKDVNFLDFLREVGKHITINYMMAKDSVSSRMETGISFTEFSYQLIQGYDFKLLYENHNIKIQAGGSDQWGNITTGIELIRKFFGENKALGITMNLLTDASGNKFGKSVGQPIWLDKSLTSSYSMYQYLLNQVDVDVEKLLKWLTYLTVEEIDQVMIKHNESKSLKIAQKLLAFEVTKDIRGIEEAIKAQEITSIFFDSKKSITTLTINDIDEIKNDIPFFDNNKKEITLIDLLVDAKIAVSKREAKEFIASKTISIDGEFVADENMKIVPENFEKIYLFIKKGKRLYYLIKY